MNFKKTYYFGNWKMNGTLALIDSFANHLKNFDGQPYQEAALFVPYPYLIPARRLPLKIGAQDCSAHREGAFTGEVSAAMLADIGVSYVLIGHSERRAHYYEPSVRLFQKCIGAQEYHRVPVICFGETEQEYHQGHRQKILEGQIEPFLNLPAPKIFAYEPLWAIGTGRYPMKEDLRNLFTFFKGLVEAPFLYGGSVNAINAHEFLSIPVIDGILVGGASLDPTSWKSILDIVILEK